MSYREHYFSNTETLQCHTESTGTQAQKLYNVIQRALLLKHRNFTLSYPTKWNDACLFVKHYPIKTFAGKKSPMHIFDMYLQHSLEYSVLVVQHSLEYSVLVCICNYTSLLAKVNDMLNI